jgi:hypothetical protein
LLAGYQILVVSNEGMGKTFLANQIYERLLKDNFSVLLIQPATSKQMICEIADSLGVSTRNLEGRSMTTDNIKPAIAQFLSVNTTILIFEDAHLYEQKFRQWLKTLKKEGVPMLLTATNPPSTDIFINLPRIKLAPLPDYCIRNLLEETAIARGIRLKSSEFSSLLEITGGNPLLAVRAIEEKDIGLIVETSDQKDLYFDITWLIGLVGIIFVCLRFIGLGTSNQALYIFSGIAAAVFMGFTIAMRSLPRESSRLA